MTPEERAAEVVMMLMEAYEKQGAPAFKALGPWIAETIRQAVIEERAAWISAAAAYEASR